MLSAAVPVLFLLTASPIFHDYWGVEESERANQFNHFTKNLPQTGGGLALLLLADGDWAYALNVELC